MVLQSIPPATWCRDGITDEPTRPASSRRFSVLRASQDMLDAVTARRSAPTAEQRQHQKQVEEQRQILYLRMQNAATRDEWRSAAEELDLVEENAAWKRTPESPDYDAKLISVRLEALDEARINCDVERMLYLVRTSLTRDLGGMGNINLYRHSRIGTKDLIERYIDSTVATIQALVRLSEHALPDHLSSRDVLDQVMCARQAFGRSALLLSGGATFGMNHVGVTKALWEEKLLPRIISGSSAGSIICSVVCTRTDEEMPDLIKSFPYGNLAVFEPAGEEEGLLVRLGRLLTEGAWIDVKHLTEVMRGLLGDMTFQEAYNRTRRVLNICVSSASVYELPRLLNYVTAPNVMIWSAVAASCSIPLLFSAAPLLIKDTTTGEHLRWNPTPQYWIDGSIDNDLPITKLAEMFNVNHFIVSQVNPHIIPFMVKDEELLTEQAPTAGSSWFYTVADLAKSEALHRMQMLADMGVFPTLASKVKSILTQKYSGDITILPAIDFRDLPKMIKNPTSAFLLDACLNGEKATWPKLSRIRNHCAVELALDHAVQQLRARVVFSPSQVDLRRMSTGSTLPMTAADREPRHHQRRVSGGTLHRPPSRIDEDESDYQGGDEDFITLSMRRRKLQNPFAATQPPHATPATVPEVEPVSPRQTTRPKMPWRLRTDDLSHESSTGETIFSANSSDADIDTHTEASSPEGTTMPRLKGLRMSNAKTTFKPSAAANFAASQPATPFFEQRLPTVLK